MVVDIRRQHGIIYSYVVRTKKSPPKRQQDFGENGSSKAEQGMKTKGKGSLRRAIETKVSKKRGGVETKKRTPQRANKKKSKFVQEGSPTKNFLVGKYGLRRAERWEDMPSISSVSRRNLQQACLRFLMAESTARGVRFLLPFNMYLF